MYHLYFSSIKKDSETKGAGGSAMSSLAGLPSLGKYEGYFMKIGASKKFTKVNII